MLDQFDSCDKQNIVHQLVKVQAQVKVTPVVKHGIPKVYCVDASMKPGCNRDFDCSCCGSDCNFTLIQTICVEIPICFDADVDIKKGILCCGDPDIKPDCVHDCRDDLNHQIFFLTNNKVQF